MLKSHGEKQRLRLSSLPPTSPTSRNNDNSGGYFIKFTSELCMCEPCMGVPGNNLPGVF